MSLFCRRIPDEDGVIPFPQKQYNDHVMVPGFGALSKYVADNDNVPKDESGQSAGFGFHDGGFVGTSGEPPAPIIKTDYVISHARYKEITERGQYIGLTRSEPQPPRHGDFMQTFSGRVYYPVDPRPEEVFIEDIAHSLALQSRYAGHCILHYSVAEHSVLIARWLRAKYGPLTAFYGLLHDATEAYCVDVPRPLKPSLANYKEIEERNWRAIATRFGLPSAIPAIVHEADTRIIGDELVNMRPMDWHMKHTNPLGVKIGCWSPEEAEQEFLWTFEALSRDTASSRGMA